MNPKGNEVVYECSRDWEYTGLRQQETDSPGGCIPYELGFIEGYCRQERYQSLLLGWTKRGMLADCWPTAMQQLKASHQSVMPEDTMLPGYPASEPRKQMSREQGSRSSPSNQVNRWHPMAVHMA